jgi:hypothetical protein
MAQSARQQLNRLLDRRVFDPILTASPRRYSGDRKRMLDEIKLRTQREKERYQHYESAKQLREMYLADVSQDTGAAKRDNDELKQLGLPRLTEVQKEFMQMCDRLGVH